MNSIVGLTADISYWSNKDKNGGKMGANRV
jgi:hypothetical protein